MTNIGKSKVWKFNSVGLKDSNVSWIQSLKNYNVIWIKSIKNTLIWKF